METFFFLASVKKFITKASLKDRFYEMFFFTLLLNKQLIDKTWMTQLSWIINMPQMPAYKQVQHLETNDCQPSSAAIWAERYEGKWLWLSVSGGYELAVREIVRVGLRGC